MCLTVEKNWMLVCQADDILGIIGWIEKPLPLSQKKYTTGMCPNHFFAIFALVFYKSVYTLRIKVW